jgi:iron-sulfur cluster repair protein YtfE (RIC family)
MAAGRIRDHGRRLIQELRSHLFKEERVLFPFAEGHLTPEDDQSVMKKFESLVADFRVPQTPQAV